ncbi:hypothetical protein DIPPA_34970 [Diplonema papillatum]|nr:hypothetical protein DIPPA_34970 [Diplonema papillatum]
MGGTEAGMKRVNDAYATVQRAKAHEPPPRTTTANSSKAATRRQDGKTRLLTIFGEQEIELKCCIPSRLACKTACEAR